MAFFKSLSSQEFAEGDAINFWDSKTNILLSQPYNVLHVQCNVYRVALKQCLLCGSFRTLLAS